VFIKAPLRADKIAFELEDGDVCDSELIIYSNHRQSHATASISAHSRDKRPLTLSEMVAQVAFYQSKFPIDFVFVNGGYSKEDPFENPNLFDTLKFIERTFHTAVRTQKVEHSFLNGLKTAISFDLRGLLPLRDNFESCARSFDLLDKYIADLQRTGPSVEIVYPLVQGFNTSIESVNNLADIFKYPGRKANYQLLLQNYIPLYEKGSPNCSENTAYSVYQQLKIQNINCKISMFFEPPFFDYTSHFKIKTKPAIKQS
jgi:hypothetical protein